MITRLNTLAAAHPWLLVAIPAAIQIAHAALDPAHAYIPLGVLSEIGIKVHG